MQDLEPRNLRSYSCPTDLEPRRFRSFSGSISSAGNEATPFDDLLSNLDVDDSRLFQDIGELRQRFLLSPEKILGDKYLTSDSHYNIKVTKVPNLSEAALLTFALTAESWCDEGRTSVALFQVGNESAPIFVFKGGEWILNTFELSKATRSVEKVIGTLHDKESKYVVSLETGNRVRIISCPDETLQNKIFNIGYSGEIFAEARIEGRHELYEVRLQDGCKEGGIAATSQATPLDRNSYVLSFSVRNGPGGVGHEIDSVCVRRLPCKKTSESSFSEVEVEVEAAVANPQSK